ncbi:hypothetical protein L1857_03745 [Amycolatopsis thermalba]|uniref:Uncharacterized protein n=1 Tax=Amycolatopsis thermalba TaxID=944492 RepID=A0ABY4NN69_9PSEU|nr:MULTISPECIES: hypothetical protein [Amycolatopsis]UQS21999.1 hypothetical protein L1857_03745 [Amycolatopsis thermalba]
MTTGDAGRGGDGSPPPGTGRRPSRFGFLLTAVGLVLLIVGLTWPSSGGWVAAAHRFLLAASPGFLVTGLTIIGYEAFVHHRLLSEIVRLAGPRIVEALLPQQVMGAFLTSVYGEKEANRDVLVGVLGGEGRRPMGADLAVSTHTEVDLELRAVDHEQYHLTVTTTYSFKKNVAVDRFVIFATCSTLLRDSISSGCQLPLFELWFIPDEDIFQNSVEDMLPSVRLGIEYLDDRGDHHLASSDKLRLREVKYDRWADYLSFFREDMGSLRRQSTRDYLGALRIFECDLSDLAEDEHEVQSIERLTLRSTTLQQIGDGYCYWHAPYPCYVDRIRIDAADLDVDRTGTWAFRVAPFMFRSENISEKWLKADELTTIEVHSWLLLGHGVALLWRPGGQWELP